MKKLRTLYPPISPVREGMLAVGDGHEIFFEECGNPAGKPAVFLHGGPGGGLTPDFRRFFNPDKYRVILFDQRGCGRSTPHAGAAETDMSAITTWHLVADMERLREFLAVEKWLVFGGSWGSTLALAYAQTHPERVSELVLRGIFTLRLSELAWFYEGGAAELFPDAWEEYVAPIPPAERGDMLAAYNRRLFNPDPGVHAPAAVAWSVWEQSTIRLLQNRQAIAETRKDVRSAIAFARIENHFFVNGGWFEDGQLVRDAGEKLAGIPAVIVQGRYDACTPMRTAWDLCRGWPQATLRVVEDAGHASSEPGIVNELILATDGFVS